ncbi:lipoprotein [Spiroplasma endosymbiont of Dioctria linearis]|uniref:lipoprotein n=1 Tax=Spiroplasma endosymbiont of Dioctria linearis TaxID=3066290 RepID=UPI00313D63AF
MKKLLGLLGAAGLVATTSATVVACGGQKVVDKSLEISKLEAKNITINVGKKTDKAVVKIVSDAKDKSILTVTAGNVADNGDVVITVTPSKLPTEKDVKEVLTVTYGVEKDGKQTVLTTTKINVTVKKQEATTPELVKIETHVTVKTLTITEVKTADAYLTDVKGKNANLNVAEVKATLKKAPEAAVPAEGENPAKEAVNGTLLITVNEGSKVYEQGTIEIALNW